MIRATILWLPLICIVAGVVLFGFSFRFPPYNALSDPRLNAPSWMDEIKNGKSDQAVFDRWFAMRASSETGRRRCNDIAIGLFVAGITLACIWLVNDIRSPADLRRLSTPATRRKFYSLATWVWLSFIPAEWLFYFYALAQGDFPYFGDAIMIPMVSELILGLIALPFILIGVRIATSRASLPQKVFSMPFFGSRPFVAITISVCIVLDLYVLVIGIDGRFFIVPSAIMTLYLLLCGRAAAARS